MGLTKKLKKINEEGKKILEIRGQYADVIKFKNNTIEVQLERIKELEEEVNDLRAENDELLRELGR